MKYLQPIFALQYEQGQSFGAEDKESVVTIITWFEVHHLIFKQVNSKATDRTTRLLRLGE
jgi:hypothetical protein